MKFIDWDQKKNLKLKNERDICFEDIIIAINDGNVLRVQKSYNSKKYPHQKMIVKINNYAFLVPFVEDDKKIFLKTIIPSRKATKKYLLKNKLQP